MWFRAEDFQVASRAEVVKLQGGDAESLKCWKMLLEQSEVAFNEIYDKVRDVTQTPFLVSGASANVCLILRQLNTA